MPLTTANLLMIDGKGRCHCHVVHATKKIMCVEEGGEGVNFQPIPGKPEISVSMHALIGVCSRCWNALLPSMSAVPKPMLPTRQVGMKLEEASTRRTHWGTSAPYLRLLHCDKSAPREDDLSPVRELIFSTVRPICKEGHRETLERRQCSDFRALPLSLLFIPPDSKALAKRIEACFTETSAARLNPVGFKNKISRQAPRHSPSQGEFFTKHFFVGAVE